MKITLSSFLILLLFSACSITPIPKNENFDAVLKTFKSNCSTKKAQALYATLCTKANNVTDAESFFKENFTLSLIGTDGLMTGYYEPELQGSLVKTKRYKYPIYNTPDDLVVVKLGSVYKNLKNYRLRGRIKSHTLVPYFTREELSQREVNASVICYTNSKIDRFFLEVQGSGRVRLENGEIIFIGFDNQNGHPYKSIGKYLIKSGAIKKEDISLQSIRKWFVQHPSQVDEVLNHNPSVVFFKQKKHGATGALGLELTPLRSIAVDKRVVPLGSMLYLSAKDENIQFDRIVFAQDTGGAIKGAVRADMFCGFGKKAGEMAGNLKADLKIWVYKPKEEKR